MLKKSLKILSYLFYLLIIFLIICFVSIFIQTRNNPQKVPSIFGISYLHVVTGSMEPTINTHDVIIIKKVDTNTLKENDIITFYSSPDKSITKTHRIISVDKSNIRTYFVTKGDNNNTNDPKPVLENQVVGKYLFRIPYLGYVLIFLSSIYGWITIIALILMFYALHYMKTHK